MKIGSAGLIVGCAIVATLGMFTRAAYSGDNSSASSAAVITSFWAVPAGGTSLSLVTAGAPAPVTSPVTLSTLLTGTCHDCGQPMQIKLSEAGKTCWVCPCGVSAGACISGQTLKHNRWDELLQALPQGTALRVTYNTAGDAASGVKSLTIDQHAALLPVSGSVTLDPSQLAAFAKTIGAAKAEYTSGNHQILVNVTGEWSAKQAIAAKKNLLQLGVTVPDAPHV